MAGLTSRSVPAEAACCAFLVMTLEGDDGGWVLDVTGPEAAPVIAGPFAPDAPPAGR